MIRRDKCTRFSDRMHNTCTRVYYSLRLSTLLSSYLYVDSVRIGVFLNNIQNKVAKMRIEVLLLTNYEDCKVLNKN